MSVHFRVYVGVQVVMNHVADHVSTTSCPSCDHLARCDEELFCPLCGEAMKTQERAQGFRPFGTGDLPDDLDDVFSVCYGSSDDSSVLVLDPSASNLGGFIMSSDDDFTFIEPFKDGEVPQEKLARFEREFADELAALRAIDPKLRTTFGVLGYRD